MKIKNIEDTKRFFEMLCQCEGSVELVTKQGDRLNLKSTFCQYVALTEMFKESKIDDIEIIASEPKDLDLIMEFLIRG